MILFKEHNDLKIGKIIEVNGNSIKVELDNKLGNLSRTIDGRVYSIGQMASVIKIHFGRKVIFGFVKMLRMSSEVDLIDEKKISPSDDSRILEADLFGEAFWSESKSKLSFNRGVETYPLPLQYAYLTTKDELEKIYQSAEKAAESHLDPMLSIGTYVGANSAVCRANMDKLFGNHCAILGSTGSGKSATVAAILHSVIEYKYETDKSLSPRIILIDPHGEYAKAFPNDAIVYRAYSESSAGGEATTELKLPYWLMSGDEFRSIIIGKTEHEATSQNNIVYEALTYARMVQAGVVKSLDNPDGDQIPDLVEGKIEDDRSNFDRDKPLAFKMGELIKHIEQVQGRKTGKKDSRTASDSIWQRVDSVLKKIRVLKANPQLKFLMEEYSTDSPSINKVLAQFIGQVPDCENKNIRIIDISGLPNEISGPLTAVIARLLFQYKLWQTPEERKMDPILIACEEAHKYVPNQGEAQYKEAQESIRRIAKEGRKYGIGLMLISQRPSDVESTVLSQCNSWIVLRLTNSRDQEQVARFLPDSLSGLTRILSSLTRREAVFVGEAAALPSRIKIRELNQDQLPDSADISFIEGWVNALHDNEKLQEVTNRWTGQ
ncbi:ATP-binding protein [Candidatus Contubernalis alkaliaceticus]|uniref:ATP-binding protein n=1 Tax=Candidatus Contubernalis alkaliaceticus TaxID=338645 RepID=UPI001F4C4E23|nr:ATP-binding protein [Candidatus Contubernalis alkalaceticus]UNC91296.1 ATP-binding protein [Candidatus Contubernalis alkalaceticus]